MADGPTPVDAPATLNDEDAGWVSGADGQHQSGMGAAGDRAAV